MRRGWLRWVLALCLVGLFAAPARATGSQVFLTHCKLVRNYQADPIVSPGVYPSAHLHSFFGNLSTNENSTYASMTAAGSNCDLAGDTAAYWIPTLYDSVGIVKITGVIAYYRDWPSGTVNQTVYPYPPDLRIISGYPASTNGSAISSRYFAIAPNWGFHCDNKQHLQASALIDCTSYAKGVKFVMNFPNCWDGLNIDSPDHRSHMAYSTPTGCPPDHPVKVPFLYVKVTYADQNCIAAGCYLASDAQFGTPPGQSGHGDFWNTWEQAALEKLVAGLNT